MFELKVERLEQYLAAVYKANVKVSRVSVLGGGADLKGLGYGLLFWLWLQIIVQLWLALTPITWSIGSYGS